MGKIIAVVGPTASGKTEYAIRLALETGAEIVSADSMQVYRHMDIGTAKPGMAERRGVAHHMIDVVEPDEPFSVAAYQKMALSCIRGAASRGKPIIVVGGTGLYIQALAHNIAYPASSGDGQRRRQLEALALERGNACLADMLAAADPDSAARIHANDTKRLIRAIEVYETTGVTLTEHIARSRAEPPEYEFELRGLFVERAALCARIDRRVDKMIESGLPDEARRLFAQYGRGGTALQAIGYKEMADYLEGRCALGAAAEKIKLESRRYAKRQMTWFRRMGAVAWIDATDGPP
ncbi:MAG: tRNA (adenosine(37)-N6)-dimethylallyltransferase MiaA [Clostridiales bacterium]|jgi:tRNA dimethylallyltransferase|nr:tRNA (adenosine(37)-N6)-dimethylallyltransferase MiaA [Clostridiales bacterium]